MRVRALLMLAVFVVLVGGCTDADDGPSGGSPEIDERSASSTTTEGTQTTAEPTCEETEAFASTLTDTGVNYDYSPTSSPAALGAKVDVVFGATLTGTLGQVRSADHQEYVSYQVEVTRVVVGSDLVSVGDRVNVMVQISPMFAGDEKYAEAARPGIEAAIFGYRIGPADGWFASVEGFTVACEGGPLMGWTGFRNAWADLTSVDEVLDAAGSGGLDGPVVHAPPADRTETNEALIQGTLELDDKCLYVVSVDPAAQRYPLVWPYGTYWEPFGPSVHSPDFPAIAVGDEFTAGGSFGSDPAALGLPPAAVEHVTSCLDSPTSEIAYVQTVEGD